MRYKIEKRNLAFQNGQTPSWLDEGRKGEITHRQNNK